MKKMLVKSILVAIPVFLYIISEDNVIMCDGCVPPRHGMYCIDMATYDGFKLEETFVYTKDGYILRVFHLYPHQNCTIVQYYPILMMSGLYISSDGWLLAGPDIALAYKLAKSCYHVYLGNNRGNKHSRNHTTFNPDVDQEYWLFSFDEMARYDMPAIIDHVLVLSNRSQLYYIGHSQGFTVVLILCAYRPEYNLKIIIVIAFSPTTWLNYTKMSLLYIEAASSPLTIFNKSGEVFEYKGVIQSLADAVCSCTDNYQVCSAALFLYMGFNNYTITPETLSTVFGAETSGSSYWNFLRWGQIVKNRAFSLFDYGVFGNIEHYGSPTPPEYDLRNYTVPSLLMTGLSDGVGTPEDTNRLMSKLVNCTKRMHCTLSNPYWSHLDPLWSSLVPDLIWPIVRAAIVDGVFTCN